MTTNTPLLVLGIEPEFVYERVLFPTDVGEPPERALEATLDIAERYEAELHVLTVVDTTRVSADVETGPALEQAEQTGSATVDSLVERLRDQGHERIVGAVVHGRPHDGILSYAKNHDIDLIVMGTHGRTGLDRYLVGSVTEKVVRLSDVPVLTVRHRLEA
ncbi:universal stress protein [Natronococcus sp. A-GB1]|uniref:universal stress protein n=1 Tax=Natronococcus sp. A-GB1 TaxID=3037648 RepID=UPI00241C49E5|nr:universal stress protein [Natronococcus sp. A-GB1]MDG5759499.1 universal stress protein [Natronococcus sp. A-GB1]